MDLSNIVNADLRRIDVGPNVRVQVTLNLVVGGTFVTDYFLNEDVAAYKNGTGPEKAALRKKYIRQAVKAYLDAKQTVVPVDQGTQAVAKAQFTEAGDT